MKRIILISLIIVSCSGVFAKKTVVSSAAGITSALASTSPGDTLMMQNGTWSDQRIQFAKSGTATNPITLLAETPGKVILTGSSTLEISGQYLTVSGLYFKGTATSTLQSVVSFRTSSSNVAQNCRLTNTLIESYSPVDGNTDTKWVSLYGTSNMVDNCSFINKTNIGTLLVVWLPSSGTTENYHQIKNNYFGKRVSLLDDSGQEINGQEIIRVGDSNTSMGYSRTLVENNIFDQCNGEIEIISNKSCGNSYRNNLFTSCVGTLTLRHGNDCLVEGNYFFGNNIPNTGGIRVIGENHKVYNNYLEGIAGSGYRAAICTVGGLVNSPLNGYFQVKNAEIAFNTLVNCASAIETNVCSAQTLPNENTTFAFNNIYNTSSKKCVTVNLTADGINWNQNTYSQGTFIGITATNADFTPISVTSQAMARDDSPVPIFEPTSASQLSTVFTTTQYPDVTTDIKGRDRTASKNAGASQTGSMPISKQMPSLNDVGVSWLKTVSTGCSAISANHDKLVTILASNRNSGLVFKLINDNSTLKLDLYTINGQKVDSVQYHQIENRYNLSQLPNGLYFAIFSDKQTKQIAKIIL